MRSAWLFLLVYGAGCYARPEGICVGNPCAPSPDAAAVDATDLPDGAMPPPADAELPPTDAQSVPVDGAPGIVECGGSTCAASPGCCLTDTGMSWTAACSMSCNGIAVHCDGPEDCGAGDLCCLDELNLYALCLAPVSCPRGGTVEWLCHTDADCGGVPCAPHPKGIVKRCL